MVLTLFLFPMSKDAHYLDRCLQLARMGGSAVQPNPQVGAVIVHDDLIIGEGFHQYPGGPHAEVYAVAAVADLGLLPKATLYVSLEPCAHTGKTPPCVELILRHGIPKVVIGCLDPHPRVSGKGVARLRSEGVEVVIAENPAPFQAINKIFFLNQERQRPYICLKWAESADGFIAGMGADGYPRRTAITRQATQRVVHSLRATYQSILIGSRTAMVDDPTLTTRYFPGPSPIRLIWNSSSQALPDTLRMFEEPPKSYVLERHSLSKHSIPMENHSPEAAIKAMGLAGISSVLVEGGRNTLQAFLDSDLYDEVYRFCNPQLFLKKGVPAPPFPKTKGRWESRMIGQDRLDLLRNPAGGAAMDDLST